MNKHIVTRKTVFSLIVTAFLVLPAFAQAQDAIGRIIRTSGIVNGVNAAGDERPLARGSNVYVDETIMTGPRGNVQLRLSDGAMVTLNEDSVFVVDDYEFDGEGGADDTVIMTMTRGTLRTITGVIGDATGDTYQMNTQFASIGVRGTEYGVVVDNTGRVRVVVFDGSISFGPITGGAPPVVLGIEGDADAAEATGDENAEYVPLDEVPPDVLATLVATAVEAVTQQQLNQLPDDDVAVEVQIRANETQRQEVQEAIMDNNPGTDDAAGAFVDAQGNVQIANNADETDEARTKVVVSVNEVAPGQFEISVSPN